MINAKRTEFIRFLKEARLGDIELHLIKTPSDMTSLLGPAHSISTEKIDHETVLIQADYERFIFYFENSDLLAFEIALRAEITQKFFEKAQEFGSTWLSDVKRIHISDFRRLAEEESIDLRRLIIGTVNEEDRDPNSLNQLIQIPESKIYLEFENGFVQQINYFPFTPGHFTLVLPIPPLHS